MAKALEAVLGDVNAAMAQYWENFDGVDGAFRSLMALCDQLSESCDTTATDVEYAKLTIIAALALLAAELAALAAAAIPTLGASTAAIPAAQIATQVAVRMVVRQLIMKLLQHAALSAAQNVLLDGAIQSLQILQGNRDRLDTGSLTSGAIEGFVEGAVSGGVSRFGSGSPLGQIGTETISGAAGSAASAAASGEGVSWQDLASGAIGGGVGAAGGGDTATRPTSSVDAPRLSPVETPASTVPSSADAGPRPGSVADAPSAGQPPRTGGLNMGITEPTAGGGAGTVAAAPAVRAGGLNMGTAVHQPTEASPHSASSPGHGQPPFDTSDELDAPSDDVGFDGRSPTDPEPAFESYPLPVQEINAPDDYLESATGLPPAGVIEAGEATLGDHPLLHLIDSSEIEAVHSRQDLQDLVLENRGLLQSDPHVQELIPEGWNPYGSLVTRDQWLEAHWPGDEDHPPGTRTDARGTPMIAGWPDSGLHPDGFSSPDERRPVVLQPGETMDRFGSPYGRFASPPGVPFPERGLPFTSLDQGYHQYQVVRPIPVFMGRIAEAMAQPGGGIQYHTTHSIVDLINAGYLREVVSEEF
ncbi:TNT domain-containing protein [Rhodococcus sp. MTM3W5.2]|uniref:TNT domain-containing protein n=1 Tax=Rhodococcus sp. MTM3W5.2 TaxID=1805827 RepID=UPI001CB8DDFC|nr:TNT domain-containing protein [Rhodococcus sp. MTM3W5.2]